MGRPVVRSQALVGGGTGSVGKGALVLRTCSMTWYCSVVLYKFSQVQFLALKPKGLCCIHVTSYHHCPAHFARLLQLRMDISTNDVFTLFMCLCLQLLSLGSTAFISRILGQAARLRLLSLSWAGILLMILTYVYAYTYTYIYIYTHARYMYMYVHTHIS